MSDTNAALAKAFYDTFQARRNEITARLENPDDLQALLQDLIQLRKQLVDSTPFLPSYDQRQYETQLRSWEQSLETLRSASKPKSKFSFKRKEPAVPARTAVVPSVPAARSVEIPSTYLTLASHSNARLSWSSLPNAREFPESDLTIADLDHCIVDLVETSDTGHKPVLTALHIRNLKNTILLLPVTKGSVLLHNLTRCIIVVGCHQFRMHTSQTVEVHLSIPSNPVIEHCSDIRFSKYPTLLSNGPLPELPPVQDFSHIRATPSPNWALMSNGKLDRWIGSQHATEESVDNVLESLLPTKA